jgi:hypothetical protein
VHLSVHVINNIYTLFYVQPQDGSEKPKHVAEGSKLENLITFVLDCITFFNSQIKTQRGWLDLKLQTRRVKTNLIFRTKFCVYLQFPPLLKHTAYTL